MSIALRVMEHVDAANHLWALPRSPSCYPGRRWNSSAPSFEATDVWLGQGRRHLSGVRPAGAEFWVPSLPLRRSPPAGQRGQRWEERHGWGQRERPGHAEETRAHGERGAGVAL